ncbi:MAG TPA: hypothetical protein VJ953_20945 [Saprospiraceae bacterium]|nr:hypothetical protein [Saprospiraceae bacterium]
MKSVFGRLWSCAGLPNWVALLLLCLIISVPVRQCFAATDAILIEQLEHNDGETEQESEKEIQKIDSDEFLVERKTIHLDPLLFKPHSRQNFGLFNSIYLLIFDPPPEVAILF